MMQMTSFAPIDTSVKQMVLVLSMKANLEHLNTHTHTKSNTRPAAEQLPSHHVSLTTRQPPGRVW